jgi:hypothetical protein
VSLFGVVVVLAAFSTLKVDPMRHWLQMPRIHTPVITAQMIKL